MTLGGYLGARLMTTWTACLLVYGAEESPDFDYEETFTGSLTECLHRLNVFQAIMDDHDLDAYLTLEADNTDAYYQGEFVDITEALERDGLL